LADEEDEIKILQSPWNKKPHSNELEPSAEAIVWKRTVNGQNDMVLYVTDKNDEA